MNIQKYTVTANNENVHTFLDILPKAFNVLVESTHIIDICRNNSKRDVVTDFINELSNFIINKTPSLQNKVVNKYYSECWIKYGACKDKAWNMNLHVDCDEYDRCVNKNPNYRRPTYTGILYLNNNDDVPTTIINKTTDTETNAREIIYSFPEKMTMVLFEGGKYYHGNSILTEKGNCENRTLLVLNIWEEIPPLCIPYVSYDVLQKYLELSLFKNFENVNIQTSLKDICNKLQQITNYCSFTSYEEPGVKILLPEESSITSKMFDDYVNNNTKPVSQTMPTLYNAIEKILSIKNTRVFIFQNKSKEQLLIKDSSNIQEICEYDRQSIDIEEPKYLQRMLVPNILSPDVCNWILFETNNQARTSGWKTDRHDKYPTTDIEVETIESVFNFTQMALMPEIKKYIFQTYSLDNVQINIKDLFIVKYEHGKQCNLDMHTDDCDITASILLSDPKDNDGCYVEYEDNIHYNYMKQGDMILHTKRHRHFVHNLVSGKRYVMVFFLEVSNMT